MDLSYLQEVHVLRHVAHPDRSFYSAVYRSLGANSWAIKHTLYLIDQIPEGRPNHYFPFQASQ